MAPLPFIQPSRIKRLLQLLKRPRTVDELAWRLDVSRRTVERYLRRIERDEDVELVRVGTSCPSRYQVIDD